MSVTFFVGEKPQKCWSNIETDVRKVLSINCLTTANCSKEYLSSIDVALKWCYYKKVFWWTLKSKYLQKNACLLGNKLANSSCRLIGMTDAFSDVKDSDDQILDGDCNRGKNWLFLDTYSTLSMKRTRQGKYSQEQREIDERFAWRSNNVIVNNLQLRNFEDLW